MNHMIPPYKDGCDCTACKTHRAEILLNRMRSIFVDLGIKELDE